MSVLLLFTASDYLFCTFKLLFVLLPFSFCHCIVCRSSIYGFWLPLWYLQASLCPFALFLLSLYCLSVFYLRFWLPLLYLQASLCPFALFLLSLYCLSFFYLRLLITSLVPSSFCVSLCPFHFVIVLSVLLLFTASDYLFGTCKLLFVILPFFFCHCIVCPSIYGFSLPLWYLQASVCPFALFLLSLYCLSFYLRLLITSLVSSSFSLSFCPFHFVIVMSVLLFTASDYLFCTFKLLFVLLSFSFCHCIVCPSSIYGFWLPLLYLQSSLCPFALFILSLYCLSFFYLRLLITSFVHSSFSLSLCPFSFVIVLSVLLLFTASDYLFGTFKLLFVLLPFSFCHCIVCPSSIYGFWLPLLYLQASLCPFALFILSLYCLSFYLRFLITAFVPSSFSLSFCPFHFVIVLSVLLLFTASDYLFCICKLLFVLLPFSICHCIVCPSIYGFWLPLWDLQASLCPFALFLLSLYCLSFYLRLLITSLVSSSFSLSFYPFHFVIVLSVLLFTASDYLFGIFKPLVVLLPFSVCHCIVCPSPIYGFWLPLWYLQASLCPFALFLLSLYCLSFYLRLLITSLVSTSLSLSFCPFYFVIVLSVLLLFTASDYLFGTFELLFVLLPFSFCHCIVCPSSIYGFWLPLWYLQASLCPFALFLLSLYCLSVFYLRLLITSLVSSSFSLSFCPFSFFIVLSVVLLFTASDYPFGIFKLFFVLLPFFFCHCIVCPSSIYCFWLPLLYLQASLCPFAFFLLSLYCLSFFYLRLLITSLVSSSFSLSFCPFHFVIVLSVLLFTVSDYRFCTFKLLFVLLPFSFCHCIVCPSSIYGFWLPLLYLQASLCPFALFNLSLYCLSFYLRVLITSLGSSSFSLSFCTFSFVIVLSVLLFTASDYVFGIFKLLFVLLPFSFCHCIVCPSIYGFWLPLWYLQASRCPFALFSLSLYCLSFSYLRLLITSLVSSSFSLSFCPFSFVIVLSVLLFTASDYLFGIYKPLFVLLPFLFCHCIVCPSSIYGFWLPLWYLRASLCPFPLFILSLYCLSFFYLWLLITSLVPSSFSLSLCPFSFVIVLSVRLLFTASDYLFGIFKLLFVLLSFFFFHCIVCRSSIYSFWLSLWYLQAFLCPFALFLLSLYCLSFFYLRLLITFLVSSSFSLSFCPFSFVIVLSVLLFTTSDYLFGIFKLLFVLFPFFFCHCIVCPSSIYGFWLPLWYLQDSLCPFVLFRLSLYCLSFYLRLLITTLVSSSLSLSFCPFHFVIVLSVLLLFTASDYLFGIFKLFFVLLPFFFCHCIVCPSIYCFWLPLWYLQASLCPFALFLFHFIVCPSIYDFWLPLWYLQASLCPFDLFILSFYCLSFFYLRLLITSLVPSSFSLSFCAFHFVVVLSVLLLFTASDYLFGIFKPLFFLLPFSFCHCIVCPSIYGFWLPLRYLQASLCPFALFILSLYCLSFFYLRFWLPLWYLQAFLCPFALFLLSLYCLSVFYLLLLITSVVPSSFSLSFCLFSLSLYCLSFFNWRFLITSLVSSSFSLSFCPFSFFIVLSVVLLFTAFDYPFGIFKLVFVLLPFFLSLYCLSFFYLRLLITFLVPSSFSLSFCPFSFVIVLSVLLFTASDYLFGIFKLLFVLLPFFFCHCIVCSFFIYGFWLPFWYL